MLNLTNFSFGFKFFTLFRLLQHQKSIKLLKKLVNYFIIMIVNWLIMGFIKFKL